MAIHQEGSDKCFVFVDHSNIWIGGKSARAKHYKNAKSQDSRFRIEYKKLIHTVLQNRDLVCGFCCGPDLPRNKPKLKSFYYSEQTIEGLMYETMYINEGEENMVFIVITGNEAVVPAIEEALARSIPVELWSWKDSASEILNSSQIPTFSSHFLDELPLEKIGFTAYKYNFYADKPIDEEHTIECKVPTGKLPQDEILAYFDDKQFLIYIRSCKIPGDEKHQLLKIEIPDIDPQEILGKPRDFKYEFTEIKDPQPLSSVAVKEIIEDAMAKESVKTEDIIESNENMDYESSKRYFKSKGYAKFYCPNKHHWYSSYTQCHLDLKMQVICCQSEKCMKCKLMVEPRFQRDAVKKMAANAVKMHLIRTSQAPDGNNYCAACRQLGTLCSEHDPESWKYCENIEKHLQNSGEINRFLAHLVFVGLPESGKTTLIARLLNLEELLKLLNESESTGIMNGIIPVNLKEDKACLHAVDARYAWRKVEFSLSCLRQMGLNHFASLESDVPESTDSDISWENDTSTDSKGRTDSKRASISEFKMADVDNVLKKDGFSAVRPFLDNKSTLYLSDTGGQIEFQELLPLLMARLAIFIFLFRLDVDINIPIKICYRKKIGGKVERLNVYTSSLTTAESFLQTLASIDAMETTTDPFTSKHKPIVFVVGTHKDCLIKEIGDGRAKEKIAEIDDKMKALIKKHKYDDLVVYADHSKDEVLFAVDNTCDNDIFQKIRFKIMSQIHKGDKFRITFPLSYLLASLHLQDSTSPIIKRSDFAKDVKQYGIQEEDVDYLLQFLHSRIGQIRHFPLEEIKEIIVNEPQALYNLVTDVITESFISDHTMKETSEVKRGIYSLESFHTNVISEISQSQIINLLKELRIVAPFTDQKSKEDKYFIPCVLNHLEEPTDGTCKPCTIQPLAIIFESGHCPKGLFGVLLHCILTHNKCQLEWKLDIKSIFRDQVSFQVGPYEDMVTIKFHTTYLDIRCFPMEPPTREVSLKSICNTIRCTLESAIEQATDILHYSHEKTQHHAGLICTKCGEPHKRVEVNTHRGTDHLIKCNSEWLSIPSEGACWFGVPPAYSFNDSNEGILKEGESRDIHFTVKSDLPIEQHTLFKDGSEYCKNDRVYIKDDSICFRNIKKSDEGEYVIASSNLAGSGNAIFSLKVWRPPKYTLDTYIPAKAGINFILKFSIDCDSPVNEHTLTKSDGRRVTKRFSVEENCIIKFRNVKVEDSGIYTISCCTQEGEKGEEEFELEITPSHTHRSPPASVTVSTTKLSEKDFTAIYKKLSPYSSRWMRIGLNLGFTYNELSDIKADPMSLSDAPVSYLSHMLSNWLQWAPGDARGSKNYATMEALSRAVDKAGLGLTAQELMTLSPL